MVLTITNRWDLIASFAVAFKRFSCHDSLLYEGGRRKCEVFPMMVEPIAASGAASGAVQLGLC